MELVFERECVKRKILSKGMCLKKFVFDKR